MTENSYLSSISIFYYGHIGLVVTEEMLKTVVTYPEKFCSKYHGTWHIALQIIDTETCIQLNEVDIIFKRETVYS